MNRPSLGGFVKTIRALIIIAATAFLFVHVPWPTVGAQSNQNSGQHPEVSNLRSFSRLVVVDVVVMDNGHPVRGLSKDVFQIFEKGHEQTIAGFEEHASAGRSEVQKPLSLPPHTYSNQVVPADTVNVLLLDALNTTVTDQQSLRAEMLNYIKNITPGIPIGIFTLGSRLRLVQGLTSDSSLLVAALNGRPSHPSPLLQEQNDSSSPTLQADASEQPLNRLLEFQTETAAIQAGLSVQITLDAFKQMARYLNGVPGRKNLIWFSGSFPLSLGPDTSSGNSFSGQRGYSEALQQVANDLAAARVAVYPVDARGLMPESLFSAANSNSSYGAAAPRSRGKGRAQPGGPGAFARDHSRFLEQTTGEHDSMKQIAEETGGTAFYSTNGFKEALAAALEEGANYYTLTYAPDDKKFDGKFRSVAVKISRGDYHLAYRRGYFAAAPAVHSPRDANALLDPATPGIQRGAPPSSQLLFTARVLPATSLARVQPGAAGLMAAKLKGPLQRYLVD